MPPRARDVLIGVSLANLCFLRAWKEILGLAGPTGYYLDPSPSAIWALLLNVLLVGIVCAGVVHALRSVQDPLVRRVLRLLFLLVLLIPLDAARTEFRLWRLGELAAWIAEPAGRRFPLKDLGPLVPLVVFACWPVRSARVAMAILFFLAPFSAVTFGRALWLAAVHPLDVAYANQALSAPAPVRAPAAARVVVLIFDELDERMAFAERPAGLRLPHLDRLRREALDATHATPPAWETALSLPALLTGRAVAAAAPGGASLLTLRFVEDTAPARASHDWRDIPTVFSRARALGVDGALVGWYHPYCRIIAAALTRCDWEPYFDAINRNRREGLAATMLRQARSLSPWDRRQRHIDSYRRVRAAGLAAVADSMVGVVIVHWPVPHHPYVYDANRGELTVHHYRPTGYLDHLRLVDLTVGAVRDTLEGAGLWARTAVIVTSDHGARVKDRPEEGQRRDARVPFILKLPGPGAVTYERPFGTVVLSDLILAVLRGQLTNPGQASRWLDRHAADQVVQARR